MNLLPLLAAAFLVQAPAPPKPALRVVQEATVRAGREHKNVLVFFHASWCSWCRRFDKLFESPEFAQPFRDSYVLARITVRERDELRANENPGWAALMRGFRGAAEQDVPYLVVLSPTGEKLSDSYRPKEGAIPNNGGYPTSPEEIEAFMNLIRRTGRGFTAEKRLQLRDKFLAESGSR
ncbi:MAG: thioredoxin family protein [Fimbriimonas sp.]